MQRTPLQLTDDPYLEAELDKLPNLSLAVLRKLQHANKEEPKKLENELSNMESSRTARVTDIPYNLFNTKKFIEWFVESNMLKCNHRQVHDQEIYNISIKMIQEENFQNLVREVFWLVHFIQMYPEKSKLIDKLRVSVTKFYSRVLPDLQKLDKSVSENVLITLKFSVAYICHASHYKEFPDIRKKFNTRFILDCYHIVIFELTGILVSDFYIHKNIEGLFGDKFFFYKEESALKLTQVNPSQSSVFLNSYGRFKKNYEVLKVDPSVSLDSRNRIYELYKQLSKKFSYIEKMNAKKSGLMANLLHSEYKKRIEKLAKMNKYDRALLLLEIDESDKKYQASQLNKNPPAVELGSREFERRTKIYLNQKKPKSFKKFKFDCTQISPPLRDLIGNSSKMPIKKKQIHMSNIQLPDFSAKDLATLYSKKVDKKYLPAFRDKTADKLSKFFGKKIQEHANLIKMNKEAEKLMDTVGVKQSLKRKFLTFYEVSEILDRNKAKGIFKMELQKNLRYKGPKGKEEKKWHGIFQDLEREKREKKEQKKREKLEKAMKSLREKNKSEVGKIIGGAFIKVFRQNKALGKVAILKQMEKINNAKIEPDPEKMKSISLQNGPTKGSKAKLEPIQLDLEVTKRTSKKGKTHIQRGNGKIEYYDNHEHYKEKFQKLIGDGDNDKNIRHLSDKIDLNQKRQKKLEKKR